MSVSLFAMIVGLPPRLFAMIVSPPQPVFASPRHPVCKPLHVALHLGMVFEPQQEAFFELATERLPDSGARFEARNPSSNGAARNFEQINAFDNRCDHAPPRLPRASVFCMPTVRHSRDRT